MTVTSRSSSCPGHQVCDLLIRSRLNLTLALVSSQFDFDIITRSCNTLASLIFKSAFSLTNTETAFVDFYEGCTANRIPLDTLRGQRVCQRGKIMYASQPCSIYRYDISIVDITTLLKNIDIDINIDMVIFENIDIDIDIDKANLKNIDIDKAIPKISISIW